MLLLMLLLTELGDLSRFLELLALKKYMPIFVFLGLLFLSRLLLQLVELVLLGNLFFLGFLSSWMRSFLGR